MSDDPYLDGIMKRVPERSERSQALPASKDRNQWADILSRCHQGTYLYAAECRELAALLSGVSPAPEYNVEYNAARALPPSRRQPSGTNLLDAVQAEAMVRYMVEGMPESQKRLILHNAMVRIATSYPCRCEASKIADKALDEAARVSS